MSKNIEFQLQKIKRGIVDLIDENDLRKKLEKAISENKPLIVKQGFDPTAPDLHLGHAVTLRKLRQLQDLGHRVKLIIGDFTAMIGDPTGRSETRKRLSREEVLKNAQTYQNQAFKILDPNKTEVVFNSEWFGKMKFEDVFDLLAKYTVAQMLEREDFANRYAKGLPISLIEFLYPIMQGYDSVMLKNDIELGGTDQKFNMLVGRYLQKEFGIEPQVIITMPILEGLDGVRKMSKSFGNYISIQEDPNNMFGKVMSIPDQLMEKYFILLTDVEEEKIKELIDKAKSGVLNPRDVKLYLAETIVSIFHDEEKAKQAKEEFIKVFSKKGIPENIPEIRLKEDKINIVELVFKTGAFKSKGEIKRIVQQGGVYFDNNRINDIKQEVEIEKEHILKVGKKKFFKIVKDGE